MLLLGIYLRLYILKRVQDSGLLSMAHLREITYSASNGHMTNKGQYCDQIHLTLSWWPSEKCCRLVSPHAASAHCIRRSIHQFLIHSTYVLVSVLSLCAFFVK